jgi:hypothetical protein
MKTKPTRAYLSHKKFQSMSDCALLSVEVESQNNEFVTIKGSEADIEVITRTDKGKLKNKQLSS